MILLGLMCIGIGVSDKSSFSPLSVVLMKIFNISKEKISEFEIPTANPLLIRYNNDSKVKDFKYLDKKREKKILFNI